MASSSWALMMVVAGAVAAAGCGEAALTAAEAAHEVLTAHELPRRLLPAWIVAFSHDPATGRFEAALEAPRTARAEVDLRHNATVAGEISHLSLSHRRPGFQISSDSPPLPLSLAVDAMLAPLPWSRLQRRVAKGRGQASQDPGGQRGRPRQRWRSATDEACPWWPVGRTKAAPWRSATDAAGGMGVAGRISAWRRICSSMCKRRRSHPLARTFREEEEEHPMQVARSRTVSSGGMGQATSWRDQILS